VSSGTSSLIRTTVGRSPLDVHFRSLQELISPCFFTALGLFVEPTPASSFRRNPLIDGPSPAYLPLPPSPAELEFPPAHEQVLSQEVDAEFGDYFDELDSYLDEAEIGSSYFYIYNAGSS
jgi:hypothetical protein